MNKINCDIIRDLLPLYCDEAVSEKTADAVKLHLATCPDCREEYGKMTETIPETDEPVTTAEKFRKYMRKSRIKEVISIVLGSILLVTGLVAGTTIPVITVPDKDIKVLKVYRYEGRDGEKNFFVLYESPIYSISTTTKSAMIKNNFLYNYSPEYRAEHELNEEADLNEKKLMSNGSSLTVVEKKPLLSGFKEEKGVEDVWILPAENVEGDFTEVKFGNTVIWTEEENGNDIVPEYVYYYEDLRNSGGWQWTVDTEKDIIGGGQPDGKYEIRYWTLDGERIEK